MFCSRKAVQTSVFIVEFLRVVSVKINKEAMLSERATYNDIRVFSSTNIP